MVTSDMLNLITLEIVAGYVWGDARSRVPLTDDNKQAWNDIRRDVRAIEAAGMIVEIPFEMLDISDYVPGEA